MVVGAEIGNVRERQGDRDGWTQRQRLGNKIVDSVCIFSLLIAVVLLNENVQEAIFYMGQVLLSKEIAYKWYLKLLSISEKIFLYYYYIQLKNIMQSERMIFRNNIYLVFVATWMDLESITLSEIR